jgi:hypothetical protein
MGDYEPTAIRPVSRRRFLKITLFAAAGAVACAPGQETSRTVASPRGAVGVAPVPNQEAKPAPTTVPVEAPKPVAPTVEAHKPPAASAQLQVAKAIPQSEQAVREYIRLTLAKQGREAAKLFHPDLTAEMQKTSTNGSDRVKMPLTNDLQFRNLLIQQCGEVDQAQVKYIVEASPQRPDEDIVTVDWGRACIPGVRPVSQDGASIIANPVQSRFMPVTVINTKNSGALIRKFDFK